MKKLLTILLLLPVIVNGQTLIGRQLVDSFPVFDWSVYPTSGLNYGLTWLPTDYTSNPSKKFPLIINLHGSGESVNTTTPTASMLTALLHTNSGIPYNISIGWNPVAVNPLDGQTYEFIVISPQNASGWSDNYDQLKFILPNILSRYRVDSTRIYLTGLSAGGDGTWTVAGSGDNAFIKQFAAMATASTAQADGVNSLTQNQVQANMIHLTSQDSVPIWAVVGTADGLEEWSIAYTDTVNDGSPTPFQKAKLTLINGVGHSAWQQLYDTAWRPRINYYGTNGSSAPLASSSDAGLVKGTGKTPDSLDVFEWFLLYSRTASSGGVSGPTANAGSNQTIALPTNSVTLNGSASTGTITSYAWTQVSGPNTATLGTPSSVSCSATGLIQGTYVFQLSVNSGASTATTQVTVNPAAGTLRCRGSKFTINSSSVGFNAGDTAFFWNAAGDTTYMPGDTLVFGNSTPIPRWPYIEMDNFVGDRACPLVITYSGTQCLVENLAGDTTRGHNGTINLVSDGFVKVDGNKGTPGVYGFLIQGDPVFRYDLGSAAQIVGTSHNIEWTGTKIRNIGTGLWMKNNGDCNLIDNYPNPGVDSVFFHDNWIVGTWNEGMYIGNTSPDNAPSGACAYDMRPITCADTTFFPVPPRIGDIHIYNNIVDSTGRGGIQLAGASVGTSYINNNTVTHNGMNGDDAQGTAISVGTYSRVIIHDNICRNTYTWAIALLGASNTGFAQQIYSNTTDSSGYNRWYNLANTSRSWINPATEPIFTDTLTWPQSIFVDTKPTCNPVDSTIVWIKNNTLKLCKRPSQQIVIQNDHSTLQYNGGNIICNNLTGSGSLANIYIDPNATGFTYGTSCSGPSPAPCNCKPAPFKIIFNHP